MNQALSFLLIVAGLYGLLCLVVYLLQARLLFRPTGTLARTPADLGLEFEDRWIELSAGERVHSWHLPARQARARVLFLHGNEGNVADRLESLGLLHGLGLELLAIDYPGYGLSTGAASEDSCNRAALAAFEALRQLEPKLPLIVWGRSMGGGIATTLIGHPDLALLVLEATFTSMPDLAAERYPWLPARWMTRLQLNSVRRLPRARVPVLVVHSREDEIIAFHHGEDLARAAGERGTFVSIHGTHGQGYFTSGEEYLGPLRHFLDEHLPPASGTA